MNDATVIGVLTYRRNDDLVMAIPPLLREAATITPPATVLIIDNDPDGGAQAVVMPLADRGVRYVHEPEPGIAAARNRALREAGARFLVFIDDDMHPDDGWLAALVRTQRSSGAAVVAGPVLPEYEAEPDEWVHAGRFFIRRRLTTGTPLNVAASGNMLLDLAQISTYGVQFDRRFGLLGGSDHLFSRTLARMGAPMVWCDEAIAFDRVPVSRMTHRWILRRAYRGGNSQVLASLALCGSRSERLAVRVRATAGGCARIVAGAMRTVAGVLIGATVHRARGRRLVRRGAGMIAGAYGHAYVEYARPQPSAAMVIGAR
ncbi:MAG: glycosyl transferase family 2 [Pseudonocardiales bacterium]|nr:MAG: glycosyl transferase family 2 [Pseudonocardiales bacterium]